MSSPIQQIESALYDLLSADATLAADLSIYRGVGNDDKATPCLVIACTRCDSTGENTGFFEAEIECSIRWPAADGRDDLDTLHGQLYDLLSYADELELATAVNALAGIEVYLAGAWVTGNGVTRQEDHWQAAVTVTCHFAPQAAA